MNVVSIIIFLLLVKRGIYYNSTGTHFSPNDRDFESFLELVTMLHSQFAAAINQAGV